MWHSKCTAHTDRYMYVKKFFSFVVAVWMYYNIRSKAKSQQWQKLVYWENDMEYKEKLVVISNLCVCLSVYECVSLNVNECQLLYRISLCMAKSNISDRTESNRLMLRIGLAVDWVSCKCLCEYEQSTWNADIVSTLPSRVSLCQQWSL